MLHSWMPPPPPPWKGRMQNTCTEQQYILISNSNIDNIQIYSCNFYGTSILRHLWISIDLLASSAQAAAKEHWVVFSMRESEKQRETEREKMAHMLSNHTCKHFYHHRHIDEPFTVKLVFFFYPLLPNTAGRDCLTQRTYSIWTISLLISRMSPKHHSFKASVNYISTVNTCFVDRCHVCSFSKAALMLNRHNAFDIFLRLKIHVYLGSPKTSINIAYLFCIILLCLCHGHDVKVHRWTIHCNQHMLMTWFMM